MVAGCFMVKGSLVERGRPGVKEGLLAKSVRLLGARILLACMGLCTFGTFWAAAELVEGGSPGLQAQLQKELVNLDFSAATIDLAKIDNLLESGAGLNFEESMVADIFAITQAEDALVNDGFILRSMIRPDRARALANSKAVKRRLFFGALLCRCRVLSKVLGQLFELILRGDSHSLREKQVYKIIVGYSDDIFLVLPRFLIAAPQAVGEDVETLKILFSRERAIALGACENIPKPAGWCDPARQELAQDQSQVSGQDSVRDSGDLFQKRYARMMAAVDSGCLAEFVSCFESYS